MTGPAPGWQHNYAIINGIQMHYAEQAPVRAGAPPQSQSAQHTAAGHGRGAVVFCHGFPMLWFSWHRQIAVIANAGYRVIAPSMRGMGQSEAPPEPEAYGVDAITADLVGLLDHCGIDKAIFVGIDFGAFAIQDLALRHPQRGPHGPDNARS